MLTNKAFYGLLGSIVLAAGLPASANEQGKDTSEQRSAQERSGEESSENTIRVVVSLPNGRRYVIEEKVDERGGSGAPLGTRVSRVLPDGSRISYGTGMTGARSANRGRASSAGARRTGGGSVSSLGGSSLTGGGGGGGSGTPARTGGGASAGGGGGGSAGAAAAGSGGGGMRAPFQRQANANTNTPKQRVPTIGEPRYSDDGATGGQNVTFHDAGISAMVIGRVVYIWGADIVQSSADFILIEGERFAFDGAVVRDHRLSGSTQVLSATEQMFAPLKLEFRAGETVTLTLHSRAQNQDLPSREIRNWTFRVR